MKLRNRLRLKSHPAYLRFPLTHNHHAQYSQAWFVNVLDKVNFVWKITSKSGLDVQVLFAKQPPFQLYRKVAIMKYAESYASQELVRWVDELDHLHLNQSNHAYKQKSHVASSSPLSAPHCAHNQKKLKTCLHRELNHHTRLNHS